MPIPSPVISDCIVLGLAPNDQGPVETAIAVVGEPIGVPGTEAARGTLTLRLKAGITADEARAIAGLRQARVQGLGQLDASGAGSA
ncbi:hypothetical protein [Ideonella sp. A 288]|uniref:hypothetical protein n=1 Tax=Ideonella sp. A 288 TaxID=1962181 RepID=UPI000B4B9791|nr:hypothetical protein [Ideonella sp. A 288]